MSKKKRKKKFANNRQEFEIEQDENFYFIAGYTSGGFPYGVTWNEVGEDTEISERENLPFE